MPKVVDTPQSQVIDATAGSPKGKHTDWPALMDGRWYRMERGTDFEARNVGAVIAAARKYANRAGGTLKIADRTESAFSFQITLPAVSADAAPAEGAADAPVA